MRHVHKGTGLRLATYRYIENIARDYSQYPKLIRQREEEVMAPYKLTDENIGGGRSGILSSTVERVATKLVTDNKLVALNKEYDALKKVFNSTGTERQRVIVLGYFKQPQLKTWNGIAMECNYSVRNVIKIKNKFIKQVAEELGLT